MNASDDILSLRLELGMTQMEFAYAIGISKAAVAMHETGKRRLPAHAWARVRALQERAGIKQFIPDAQLQKDINLENGKIRKQVEAVIAVLENERMRLQEEITLMKSEYDALCKKIQVIQPDRNSPANNAYDNEVLELIYLRTVEAMWKVSPNALQILVIELNAVDAKLEAYRAHLLLLNPL